MRGVAFNYENGAGPVLSDLSVEIESGTVHAIVGPNGAGKSTLLGCLTGDRAADSGSVRICGHDPLSDQSAAASSLPDDVRGNSSTVATAMRAQPGF